MSRIRKTLTALVLLGASIALPFSASADVITFGNTQVIPLTGTTTEGAFTYEVISGSQWGLQTNFGNPPGVLSTGPQAAPNIGDRIDFYLTGGGLFTFDQFDFGGFANATSDGVNFIGSVNFVVTHTLLGIVSTSSTFQTMAGFGGPIDRLSIIISSVGVTDLGLDNLVLTQVPVPGTLVLFLSGLLLVGFARKKLSG